MLLNGKIEKRTLTQPHSGDRRESRKCERKGKDALAQLLAFSKFERSLQRINFEI